MTGGHRSREPWVRHEDEHLLAVSKPAGVNTHRADVHAQDGMYEWVQRQRADVALSVLHRLDKATSGVLVFGKSSAANRSLAAQFEQRTVDKRYELIVRRDDERAASLRCSAPIPSGRDRAEQAATTDFELVASGRGFQRYAGHPRTGRTHQVRIHADSSGMPIVGDAEHHGDAGARLFLHAAHLRIDGPDGTALAIDDDPPPSFDRLLAQADRDSAIMRAQVAHEARTVLFDPADTDAYLWIDRDHDGFPGVRVERLGDAVLVRNYTDAAIPTPWLEALDAAVSPTSVYEQHRPRSGEAKLARLLAGRARPRFEVVELGLRYLVDLDASATSSGLFLDQRETRRELLDADLRGRTVLNTFAHTGSLSVATAAAGAETLTLDLSKRYLDWAAENLRCNDIDPADHDFIYGDALEWMTRLAKKGRTFDLVLVDPPSSSTTRKGAKRWSVERDLDTVVERAVRLTAGGGTVFVSTNHRKMPWAKFLGHLERGLAAAGREGAVETRTLPLDHRSGPGDPPYLKAAWIALDGRDRALVSERG